MKKRISIMLAIAMVLCMIPGMALAAEVIDTWDGTADISWYNNTATEFVLTTAEQLAGLAELVDDVNTFAGKTVKLGACLDLKEIIFNPIGSYRQDKSFMGTFDGQGHTIKNLSQNTWALNTGYAYSDLGLGLFGKVEDATIKNLRMDGANISGESAICGTVAACAYGDCVFENIDVVNSTVADYQYYAGGVVGWASGKHQYINCDVYKSTTVAAQWGDFDNSTGGLIGGCGGNATIHLEDCDVACRIDAYNDVTSSYQWYAYRRCGMLIGNPGKTITVNGKTYADAPQLTAENCTVTYCDWAKYTYCEFAGTSWPYVRVQAGVSNSAYSNPRYGHPTDANGNEVVDDNHVHNDGEDHLILCKFNQLYGGGQGVYGTDTHEGVTVKDDCSGADDPTPGCECRSASESKPENSGSSSGSGIKLTYNGGNSFSTSKSDVPTGVEIDNVPVSFSGDGNNFTVGCIDPNAKWVTVRWNSTSVTTNFTPDGNVVCTEVIIPKTGDVSFWTAIAQFFGF
ncbi:MAG: hypothetical protein IKU32_03740 [Clostridia bacterium]|nr:hypothetical protein [Clostridia bacterium]